MSVLVTGIHRVLGRGRLPLRRMGSFTAPTCGGWIPGSRPGMTEVGDVLPPNELSRFRTVGGAPVHVIAAFDSAPGASSAAPTVSLAQTPPHSPSFQALSLESTASSSALQGLEPSQRQWAGRISSCGSRPVARSRSCRQADDGGSRHNQTRNGRASARPSHAWLPVGRGPSANLDQLAFLDRLHRGVGKGQRCETIGA
ncbi:hypothetical protein AMC82_CH03219 [Rhizobium phaseoli]|nr:hypothetical protein AMC84_CH03232 [Rhizobium phaseoli]ANL79651.1 hypothetical protein AMC82_CH03219 [Rhizobium phaseoli]ANM05485.1 hypothetical protein AMC78_CH03422 [Rhizobium phaseoli]